MQVLVKTFKGSEENITTEINKELEICQGRWGEIMSIKIISSSKNKKTDELELTLLIEYRGSASISS